MSQQLTPIILPIIIILALALAAPIVREGYRILRSVRVRLRSRTAQAAIDGLTVLAGTAVAAAAEEVRNLKDPTKPGEWNRTTAARIRDRVIGEVMELGRDLITQLKLLGVLNAGSVYDLLERMVEAQVERLRRLDPTSSLTPLVSADLEEPRPTMAPSPLRASTIAVAVAPPPSPGQRGTVRFVAVAVLLALCLGALAVGAVLSGCRPPADCDVGHDTWRCSPEGIPQHCDTNNRWRSWATVPCARVGQVCALRDGRTTCVRPSTAAQIPPNPFADAGASAPADGGLR